MESIREKLAVLFLPPKDKENMADTVKYDDHAAEAFALMAKAPDWETAIKLWRSELQGRIKSLRWVPTPAGVSEKVIIKFPDNSGLCLDRFIRRDEEVVHTKLFRYEERG